MKNKNILIMALLLVIVGGTAFWGGMKYQQNKKPSFGNGTQMRAFNGNGTGANQKRMGNGQVVGEIISVDDKSITVKTNDGSSKIILVGDSTAINKASAGQKSDLAVGEKVAVFGTSNSDGSVSGTNIQLNPTIPNNPSGAPSQSN